MIAPSQILDAVHSATGIEPGEIVSKSRRHSVLYPRYIALLLLRKTRPFFSDHELGQLLGIESHGTARHALIQAKHLLEHDEEFRKAHAVARQKLGLEHAGKNC